MAKIPNDEWWRKRYKLLRDTAAKVQNIEPDVVYDKNGMWPAIKLVWMQYGLGLYCPIMVKQREYNNFDRLHFIDLCAGSGLTTLETPRGAELVAGSALIGASDSRFDEYHFVEPRKSSANVLEKRLARVLSEDKFKVYKSPRAEALQEIVQRIGSVSSRPHYLAFVDPEGFTEVTLPELDPLFKLSRGDFMFNYQHMGAKRAPAAASRFLGRPDLEEALKAMTIEQVIETFLTELRKRNRPQVAWIPVETGTNTYAYGVVYAAVQTKSENKWLDKYRAVVKQRMEGLDGAMLANLVGGQRRLDSPTAPAPSEPAPSGPKQSKLF